VRDARLSANRGSSCPAPRASPRSCKVDDRLGMWLRPHRSHGTRIATLTRVRATSAEVQFTTAEWVPRRHAPRSTSAWTNFNQSSVPANTGQAHPRRCPLGRRPCTKDSHSYAPSGDTPYLIRPDGMIVRLKVIGDIPYIVPTASILPTRFPSIRHYLSTVQPETTSGQPWQCDGA
jgi:hypothetical protein